MSRPDYDPATARALDAFEAPPLSPGFAARVTAAAQTSAGPLPPPSRRDRRGGWTRGRSAALGLVAAGLMSATAAAAGLFGDLGVTVPALERVVARIADDPEPAPVPERAAPPPRQVARAKVVVPEAETLAAEPVTPPPPPTVRAARRELVAQRAATRLERRIARRERLGLPVDPRLKDPDARLDPETAARFPERAALVERVQEIRRARREEVAPDVAPDTASPPVASEEGAPGPAVGDLAETPPERFRDLPPEARAEALRRLRAMTPAERAATLRRLREMRQRRRAVRPR